MDRAVTLIPPALAAKCRVHVHLSPVLGVTKSQGRTPFILIQRDDKVCARACYGSTQLFSSAGYNYLTITIAGASALLVYIIFNSHKVNFLPIKRVTP